MRLFDRNYKRGVLVGLAAIIWFATPARAAHDIWAATAVFAVETALALVLLAGKARDGESLRFPLLVPTLFTLAAAAASAAGAYELGTTLFEVWVVFFCFVFFYLFVNAVDDSRDAEIFLGAAGAVLVPLALIVILSPRPKDEASYFLVNANTMAGFGLYWVLPFWTRFRADRRWTPLFAAAFAVVLLSVSWWADIVLVMGFLLHHRAAFTGWARARRAQAIALLAAGAAVLAAVLAYKVLQADGIHYGAGRLYWWASGLRMFLSSPLTGVGLGGFETAYPYFDFHRALGTRYAHSFPLQILCETGLLGVAAAAALFWDFLRAARGSDRAAEREPFWIALVCVLAFSAINISMVYFLNKLMLAALAGTIFAGRQTAAVRPGPLRLAAAAAVFLCLVPFWSQFFFASRLFVGGRALEKDGDLAGAERAYRAALSIQSSHAGARAALAALSLD